LNDKCLIPFHLSENEVDLIVGDGEEKRLADLLGKANDRSVFV
jgi:hypothetical protein